MECVPLGRDTADNLRERWGASWFVEDKADEEKASNNKLPPACWLTSSCSMVELGAIPILHGIPPDNKMPLRWMGDGEDKLRTFGAQRALLLLTK